MAIKEIIATGKDVAEAKENARATLGVGELDNVQFEVLNLGSRGIFGIIGVKPAQVRAFIEIPDAPQRQRHDKKKNHRPENATNIGANENKETSGEAKPQNNHKKKKKKPAHHEGAPKGESKPKSEVIPECELKFELREVEDGVDMSFDFIKTLISDIGLEAEAKLYSCDDGTRRITISGNDASTLIGHHGDTLDALQYLANLASARKNRDGERDKSRVTLDIEGYRAKREETLRALARRMAAKAIRNNRSVMLEPMSAYERRIIHSEIQGIEGVCTNSIGSDNNRKIVIYLTEKKPEGIFEEEKYEEEEEIISTSEAVETVTTSDLEEANETVAVEITHPDENEDSFAPGEDEDDIK